MRFKPSGFYPLDAVCWFAANVLPALRQLGWEPGSLPETEKAAAENLALPLWGGIDAEVQERVVATVLDAVGVASARA